MATFEIGRSVKRIEDDRLLRGVGKFIADINDPNQAVAFVLRSPHAHAEIAGIDIARAVGADGILAVFTAADIDADEIGDLPCLLPVATRDGRGTRVPPAPPLARERVRYVGEPVAMIVADSEFAARDGAEMISVDYRALPAAIDTARATASPLVWDNTPENTSFLWEDGDAAAVADAFASATHRVHIELTNNRIVVHPMEPRGALGSYEAASARYTLVTTSQGGEFLQSMLADDVLKVPRDNLRVVTPDVGGAFGTSLPLYPEQVLVLWAARRLGRPVKWLNDRSQSFVSDTQGRDHVTQAELAIDADGRFMGLRVAVTANMGALLSTAGPAVPTLACKGMQSGVYRIAAVEVSVRGVFTNTVPVDAYRGAGNPETHYMLERLIDVAAVRTGIDRLKLRQRNLIATNAIPFTTALGHVYDSGDFGGNMSARRPQSMSMDSSGDVARP